MKKIRFVYFLALSMLCFSCSSKKNEASEINCQNVFTDTICVPVHSDTPLEAKLRAMGMVDIAELDSSIAVYLVYATPYNFMGRQLYSGLNKAFMLPDLANRVVKAQQLLKAIRPDLNLMVYDAARPISIQREMWNKVKNTDKRIYVSNPDKGHGMHNYGAAVDVTLMDCTGNPLPMGSEYDFFGREANIDCEQALLTEGRITVRELENRLLLRKVMTEAGLLTIDSEWWHFNLMSVEEAQKQLKVIDF